MTPDVQKRFVNLLYPIATDEENRSGIDPLITITQAAHESGWGQSELTKKANNLFGFTGESWEQQGKPVIRMPTREWVASSINNTTGMTVPGHFITIPRPFRAYKSWAESVRDWSTLMQGQRYHAAYTAAKLGDLSGFAKAVYEAGYATDPDYAAELVNVGGEVLGFLPDEDPADAGPADDGPTDTQPPMA